MRELPGGDVRAGSRSWHMHGLSQVNQRLLAHFQDPFLRSVEIRNEPYDRRKGEGDGKFCERSARSSEASVIAHGGERKDGDREKRHPDGTGNATPQAGCHPFRVEVDHLIERLDEETDHNRSGVVLSDGHCLRPQLVVQVLRPAYAFRNVARPHGF